MPSTSPEPQSTPPESPPTLVKEAAVEASFGCILRLKNAVNDEFLQDLLRKVMNTVFFNGEIKFEDAFSTVMETINENTALDNRDDQEQCILLDQGMKSMARFSRALGWRFLKKILSSSDVSLKVQAAMATYHFVENCTLNMLQPYLDEII
ncbi:hypothetical protein OIU78_027197, partial [Salix suchowensis]